MIWVQRTIYVLSVLMPLILISAIIASISGEDVSEATCIGSTPSKDTANVIVLLNWTNTMTQVGKKGKTPGLLDQLRDTVPELIESALDKLSSENHLDVTYAYFGLVYGAGMPNPDFTRNFIKYSFRNEDGYTSEDWARFCGLVRHELRGRYTGMTVARQMAMMKLADSLEMRPKNYLIVVRDNFSNYGPDPASEMDVLRLVNAGLTPDREYRRINGIDEVKRMMTTFKTYYNLQQQYACSLRYEIAHPDSDRYLIVEKYELLPVQMPRLPNLMRLPPYASAENITSEQMEVIAEFELLGDQCRDYKLTPDWIRYDYYGCDGEIMSSYGEKVSDSALGSIRYYDIVQAGDVSDDEIVLTCRFDYNDEGIFGKQELRLSDFVLVRKNRHEFAVFFEVERALLKAVSGIPLLTPASTATVLNGVVLIMLLLFSGMTVAKKVLPGVPGVRLELHKADRN